MQYLETGLPMQALAWVRNGENIDVGILDMQMPVMDGLTLAKEIQKVRDAASLPLIMLTSLGRRELGDSSVSFAAFLNKPIKPSQLFNALVEVFSVRVTRTMPIPMAATPEFDATMGARFPLSILLAEDNLTNQKLAIHLLGRLGYTAGLATNGLEVLQVTADQAFDVILMDVQMPELDGLEATRRIRERADGGHLPYIVAMTANAMERDRETCLAAGMNDYVSKPIRIPALVEALERAAAFIRQHVR